MLVVRLLTAIGNPAPARAFLDRLVEAEARSGPDSVAAAFADYGRFYWATYAAWDPWCCAMTARRAARIFTAASDTSNGAVARALLGWAWVGLGAYGAAEEILRENIAAVEGKGIAAEISRLYLGLALASRGALEEAEAVERETLSSLLGGGAFYSGWARTKLAEVLLCRNDPEGASREATSAVAELAGIAPHRAHALAVLADARRALGRSAEAVPAAREAVATLEELGISCEGAVRIRVALAEALHATGDETGARRVAKQAYDRVLASAAMIPDADARAVYRRAVPENARAIELATGVLP
jgi:tetratricopeptide (TPR) repeat protein